MTVIMQHVDVCFYLCLGESSLFFFVLGKSSLVLKCVARNTEGSESVQETIVLQGWSSTFLKMRARIQQGRRQNFSGIDFQNFFL